VREDEKLQQIMFSSLSRPRLFSRKVLPCVYRQISLRMQSEKRPTAGIIIIGDEILKGQTQDVNTYFLAGEIKRLGISLSRVSVISDIVDVIANEVRNFSKTFDFVFTSGGVGPTHDDVTFQGVAEAFDVAVERNPKLVEIIDAWTEKTTKGSKDKPSEGRYKLADIPATALLNFATQERVKAAKLKGIEVSYPLVTVSNVFVFPGIPFLLRKSFENVAVDLLCASLATQHLSPAVPVVAQVFVTDSEWFITDRLNQLVESHSKVTFGSYPEWTHSYYKTKLTLEADSQSDLDAALAQIASVMPTINYDTDPCQSSLEKIESFKQSTSCPQGLATAIDESLAAVSKAFEEFGPDRLVISLNGGKDCVVVVHLVHAVFQQRQSASGDQRKMKAFYIREKDPFKEVDVFIDQMEKMYRLEMQRLDGPMKSALETVFKTDEPLKGCFLGTRNGDPGASKLGLFSKSDGGWAPMMRVNPILNWDYHMIWQFIRGLSLAYPTLYDRGYTSLGNTNNTRPNPHLKNDGDDTYRSAHLLEKGEWEREGRL